MKKINNRPIPSEWNPIFLKFTFFLKPRVTGYSFWDRLHNFLQDLHELFCKSISWTNSVNSGKFMDNCLISCQVIADMEKFYDNLIIIKL